MSFLREGAVLALCRRARHSLGVWGTQVLIAMSLISGAYATGLPPSPTAVCAVSAFNRTAPLASNYSFTLFNLPSAQSLDFNAGGSVTTVTPPFRARVTCSDGVVGDTELVFPSSGSDLFYTGEIRWGNWTPIPLALSLVSSTPHLSSGDEAQVVATGVYANATTADLTQGSTGTYYTSSNPLVASVGLNGLVSALTQFTAGSSTNVLIAAQNEGLAASTLLRVGPRGTLYGHVYRADGVTAVEGAEVAIVRNQPRETLGVVRTDAAGAYQMENVPAGMFSLSVVDRATGDLGRGFGEILTADQRQAIDVRLLGIGSVTVNVESGSGAPVSGAAVTITSLTGFSMSRSAASTSAGQASFAGILAGDFSVIARDAAGLVGAAVGRVAPSGSTTVTIRLQPVGVLSGRVFAADGISPVAGVQVRLVSSTRGIVSQRVTGTDGQFRFDAIPANDGTYGLDAMLDGRLRARATSIALTGEGQELIRNLVFVPSGTVRGVVRLASGAPAVGATVRVQQQSGEQASFQTKTDTQGVYRVDGVLVGTFVQVGYLPDTGASAP